MNTRSALKILSFAAIVLLAAGTAIPQDGDAKAAAGGNTEFAANLYGRLRENPGNLFFSPFSVSTALAMTMSGARGNTEKEMADVLKLRLERPKLHAAMGGIIRDLNSRKINADPYGENEDEGKPAFQLVIANALFGQRGFGFLPEFLEGNRKAYDAGFSELDFKGDPEGSRVAINDWVLEKTRKRVPEILRPGMVTPDTRLALANAIYFIAQWADSFEERLTREGDFSVDPKNKVKVPFMRRLGTYRISDAGAYSALVLPYREGELVMAILLPKDADGLGAVEAGLTPAAITAALRSGKHAEVDVKIPKFRIESYFDLKDTLIAMGMKDAFSDKAADFSGMTGRKDLYIGLVIHKSFVRVDEKGTEAAAATVVMMWEKGMPQKDREFHADRPFLFLIADLKTDSVLFMGRVADPSK